MRMRMRMRRNDATARKLCDAVMYAAMRFTPIRCDAMLLRCFCFDACLRYARYTMAMDDE